MKPILAPQSRERRAYQALFWLRVLVGAGMLYSGISRFDDPAFGQSVASSFLAWAEETPFPIYRHFLMSMAIPHAPVFAFFVMYGEVLLGASLIFGVLVPMTALALGFVMLNCALASWHLEAPVFYLAFFAIAVTLFWGDAGQYLGLDRQIFKEQPDKVSAVVNQLKNKLQAGKKPKSTGGKATAKAQRKSGEKKSGVKLARK